MLELIKYAYLHALQVSDSVFLVVLSRFRKLQAALKELKVRGRCVAKCVRCGNCSVVH